MPLLRDKKGTIVKHTFSLCHCIDIVAAQSIGNARASGDIRLSAVVSITNRLDPLLKYCHRTKGFKGAAGRYEIDFKIKVELAKFDCLCSKVGEECNSRGASARLTLARGLARNEIYL